MEKLLLKACQNGQKGVVLAFLKKDGLNVNAVDEAGFAPLHYACRKGYRDIVKLLLEKEADVTLVSNESITPLHLAVTSGNKEIISMLLEAGADINATDREGKTVLIYGVEAKKVEAVKHLIELGADVSIMDNQNHTALDYANALGLTQLIASVSVEGMQQADAYGNTPLHTACASGNAGAAKLLMESGADDTLRNVNGETPAHLAVMKKRFGGDLKAEQRKGVLEVLEYVDLAGNDGRTPLILLQYLDINTIIDVMPLLLEKGADVNHADNKGNTALLVTAQNQCYKGNVKELVRAGADVNAANKDGNTALHFALRYGDQESARFLIKKGADYNYANNEGVTPVQITVEKGYDTVLELMTDIEG